MSRRKVTLAINNIFNNLDELKVNNPSIFDKTLKTLGFTKVVYERCYSLGLYRLNNIFNRLSELAELYDYDGDKLITLSRNIRKVYRKYNVVEKTIKPKTNKPKSKKKISSISNKRLLNNIDNRANGVCCLCATFKELSKINRNNFISLMKKEYPRICEYDLTKERIKSWQDEYDQIIKTFIPVFKRRRKKLLDFHIIFEMKLPKIRTNLGSDKYVYSDAVIVGDDGFVVLEFKQRDASDVEAINYFCSQALKYIKRLRFHKKGRLQKYRYTYLVLTNEPEINVWTYDDKEDFWYGNTRGVAEDICSEFFDKVKPINDIEEWLTAGFKEKKSK